MTDESQNELTLTIKISPDGTGYETNMSLPEASYWLHVFDARVMAELIASDRKAE